MKIYRVYWSFSYTNKPEECATLKVRAYNEKDACCRAASFLNNSIARIVKTEEISR